jgi:hypothetical protein
MKNKTKYKIKAIINPRHWLRNNSTHKAWDKWLWESLNNYELEEVGTYRATINGQRVWISNYPYASGSFDGLDSFICSRATNILLREKLQNKLPF